MSQNHEIILKHGNCLKNLKTLKPLKYVKAMEVNKSVKFLVFLNQQFWVLTSPLLVLLKFSTDSPLNNRFNPKITTIFGYIFAGKDEFC